LSAELKEFADKELRLIQDLQNIYSKADFNTFTQFGPAAIKLIDSTFDSILQQQLIF